MTAVIPDAQLQPATVSKTLEEANRFYSQGDFQSSATLLEDLVGTYPDCAAAWVLLGRLALTVPDIEAALDFFGQARVLCPDDPAAWAWQGDAQRRGGMRDEALVSLQRARELAPEDLIVACKLANCYVDAGELLKARELLSETLSRFPCVPELYLLRGLIFRQMRNNDEAEADLRLCLSLAADTPAALAALADISRERQLLDVAADYLARAIALAPDDVAVLRAQGDLFLMHKEWAEATRCYDKVLEQSPDDLFVSLNRAAALVEMGDALRAVDALEACLAVGASEQWVYEMLGLVFAQRGDWSVALESLEKGIEQDPTSVNTWNILIVAYNKLGMMEKAGEAARKALEINPDHIGALSNMAGWYLDQGRHEEGVATFRRVLEADPRNAVGYAGLMFCSLFASTVKAKDILETGRKFDRDVCLPLRKTYDFSQRNKSQDRVLRIGWVSSDLRAHPVGAFVGPFFPYLDPLQVETYVYDNWPREDEVTAMIKPSATVWRQVRGMGDNAMAECIRADEIDILVDLNGHTAGHRLGVFARKPAPVQVEWLGFPGTSGMATMDYVFVPNDDYLLQAEWASEKPWPLPNAYGVRSHIPDVKVRDDLPLDDNGYFTFACMNRYSKVSAAALDLWAEILLRTENSKLLLIGRGGSEEQTLTNLRDRFAKKGVAADRLVILGSLPVLEYFDAYNRADVCLDPFPFNGGTTGFDSIWMGVPFVTLRGDALHSRAGSNILKYVGLSDLVADTQNEYVEKAVALTRDLSLLRGYRANLRQRMQDSPLMDCEGFARGLENAFRGMWKNWCINGDGVK